MPIRAKHNLYPGINPHLNSRLQQPDGDWQSFHAYHIIHLADILNSTLPNAYYAKPEKSLQIKVYDPPNERISKTKADIAIAHSKSVMEQIAPMSERGAPTLTLPIIEVVEEMDELTALVIYHNGKPVTRIELLLPANKFPGSHYNAYIDKRAETLYAGLRFVEIDYLHERPSTVDRLPHYPNGDKDSFPYHVIVFDPRPTFEKGQTLFYGFGVLSPLPIIDIPLDGADSTVLDFNTAYNQTFSRRPFSDLVDYAELPAHFEAYTEADQQALRQRMTEIATQYPPE